MEDGEGSPVKKRKMALKFFEREKEEKMRWLDGGKLILRFLGIAFI